MLKVEETFRAADKLVEEQIEPTLIDSDSDDDQDTNENLEDSDTDYIWPYSISSRIVCIRSLLFQ